MKIEIQSIKLTFKWWQIALIIASSILSFNSPSVILKLLQICISTD